MADVEAATITQDEWRDMKRVVMETHDAVIALKTTCEQRPKTCELLFRKRNGQSAEVQARPAALLEDRRTWAMWGLGTEVGRIALAAVVGGTVATIINLVVHRHP